MADELKVSIKTIEKHRQSLMDKLDIHSIAGLTRHAAGNGVIEAASAKKILVPTR
jgi:DNA-binding NarL/FixJ family response regulator